MEISIWTIAGGVMLGAVGIGALLLLLGFMAICLEAAFKESPAGGWAAVAVFGAIAIGIWFAFPHLVLAFHHTFG